MENRDRDKMSENTSSTSTGDVNRSTSSRKGQQSSDSDANFGQNIGRSENLGNEPSRRSGSSGSSGVSGSSSSDKSSDLGDSGIGSESGSRSGYNSSGSDRSSGSGSRH